MEAVRLNGPKRFNRLVCFLEHFYEAVRSSGPKRFDLLGLKRLDSHFGYKGGASNTAAEIAAERAL